MFYYYDRVYDHVGICKSKKTRDAYVSLFPNHCDPIPSRTARKYLVDEMLPHGSGYDEMDATKLSMRNLCDEVLRVRELMGGE